MNILQNHHTTATALLLRVGLMLLLAVGAVGCISDDLSVDPNGINDEALRTREGQLGMLVALQSISGDFYSGDRSRIHSIWSWQMAGTNYSRPQPVRWTTYSQEQDGPTDDNWQNGYRAIRIANDIVRIAPDAAFASPEEQSTVIAIAKAYKGMAIAELAAMYGSIPVDIVGFDPPTFVSQSEAYATAQQLFDEALAGMSGAAIDQDLNYGGDAAMWVKTIHSLKARYYLHVKDYTRALSESAQGIDAPEGTLYAIYTSNPIEMSNWGHWRNNEGDDDAQPIMVEKSYMDLLKADPADTRLAEYFEPKDSGFLGFAAHGQDNATESERDPLLVANLLKYGAFEDDFPIISYEENVLIQAEAEARAGSLTNAETLLNTIRAGAGLADTTAVDQSSAIDQILMQKNLELFLEGQAYYDLRRIGKLPESAVPLRWIYPFVERNANPNVPDDDDALVTTTLP